MRRTVMILSTSGTLTEMVAWALEGTRYSLVRTRNILEAIEYLKQENISCLMIDLFMPRWGDRLLHEISKKPAIQGIPLILLSNDDAVEQEEILPTRFARVGVPFNRESFLSILHLLIT